nr:tape measure protein [Gordonibacter massiliensis (ex Traore et al. 2017)]
MDVESAMASCNEAVAGSAFGLDAAATVATQLGAAGVASGDAMTGALKSVAGVAAMSGSSMEDVGAIFSKVAAKGKVGGDELLQLTERGINATAALGKYLGKSADEVSKMVSSGQIDFATFSAAMEATFGEAASGANATFQGAMSNVMAALSRVGAKFASPALDGLRRVFVALIPAIDAVSKVLDPAVEAFTRFVEAVSGRAVSGIEAFTEALGNTGSFLSAFKVGLEATFEGTALGALISKVNGFVGAVRAGTSPVALLKAYWGEFLDMLGSRVEPIIESVKGKIGSLPQPIQNLIGFLQEGGAQAIAFGGLFAAAFAKLHAPIAAAASTVGGFAAKVGGLSDIASTVGGVVASIGTKLNTFGSAVTLCGGGVKGLVTVLGGMLNPVTLVVAAVAALAAGFVYLMSTNEGFRNTVIALVEQIGAGLAPMLDVVGNALQGLAATVLPMVTNIVSTMLPVIGQVITVILQIVSALAPVISTIVSVLVPVLKTIIEVVVAIVSAIVSLVMPVISAIVSAISTAMPIIQSVIESAMGAIQAVFDAVWPVVEDVVDVAMTAIQNVISIVTSAINGDWEGVWNGIKQFFSDIWNGLKRAAQDGVDAVYDVVTGIKDKITGFFAGCGKWLSDSGRAIVEGLADGIKGAIDFATGAISDVLGAVRSFLPFSPAKTGPFSGKGWSLYSGRAITEALAEGISGRASMAVAAMSGVMSGVSDSMAARFEVDSAPCAYDAAISPLSNVDPVSDVRIDPSRSNDGESVLEMLSNLVRLIESGAIKVVTDTGALVGELAPAMDGAMGELRVRRSR